MIDLGAWPALAPRIAPGGGIIGVLHSGEAEVSPRLVRWESALVPGVVQTTPHWLEPTRLAIGPGDAAVLSGWDTRGAWLETPYVQHHGDDLIALPHEGKFPGSVSLAAVAMSPSGAVYGFGRLEAGDLPVAYDDPGELPKPLPELGAGARVESGFAMGDGSLVMSVSGDDGLAPRTLRFDGAGWTDLGDPSESGQDGWMIARGVSPHGRLVGAGATGLGEPTQPVLVELSGVIQTLGLLSGWISGEAEAMNAGGWVVGSATVFDEHSFELRTQAFAWTEGAGLIELEGAPGWTLLSATGISDDGWVVGIGVLDGVEHAYAMRIPTPATILLLLGVGVHRRSRMIR